MKYLILSTYPSTGSRNSGDDLLGKSLIKLLKNIKGKDIQVDTAYIADTNSADKVVLDYNAILAPALRPTVIGNSVAPKFRNDYVKLAVRHNMPFYAIGAGWSQYPGTVSQSKSLKLDPIEKGTFKKLFNQKSVANRISCRDIYTENVLKGNGISCYGTTGDLGLFDTDFLGLPFKHPNKIKNIAVSMPHNIHHRSKAYEIAMKLKKRYSCNVKLVFHGYFGKLGSLLPKDWLDGQIQIIDLAGGAEKLNYYDKIDLHVGFRLHAHIWFLRTRKPSLLIAEDGRGTGHLATVNGLGYSAVPNFVSSLAEFLPEQINGWRKYLSEIPPSDDVYKMLDNEINSGFDRTKNSLKIIDHLWKVKMKPFLNTIAE
ncbi:polysaccharide pyruvyl transferase family protein [Oceanobacillus damuensis]|uniref:polysaccharide pyruvyl transferase family protein n=1 Tax=Oceanobacillus damuensis TaxID=937928 RepID=UPI0008362BC8|nr:polysaccharide pyruvyl transferase family protein [Oceanobacillus damuensis]